jgi:hypothetical protein
MSRNIEIYSGFAIKARDCRFNHLLVGGVFGSTHGTGITGLHSDDAAAPSPLVGVSVPDYRACGHLASSFLLPVNRRLREDEARAAAMTRKCGVGGTPWMLRSRRSERSEVCNTVKPDVFFSTNHKEVDHGNNR